MNEEYKRKADVLLSLCNNSWTNFYNRRAYQWKFGFAIWTAISIFITLVLKNDIRFEGHKEIIIISFIILFLLHGFWLFNSTKINNLDKEIVKFYEKKIHELLYIEFEEDLKKKLNKTKGKWSPFVQILITILLLIMAYLCLINQKIHFII